MRLLPMTMIPDYETIAYDYDSLTMRLLPMTVIHDYEIIAYDIE